MAELVFIATDRNASDPKDWKPGDPIEVGPDGTDWGVDVRRPPRDGGKFYVIRVTGLSVENARKYVAEWTAQEIDPDGTTYAAKHRARRYRLVYTDLPNSVRNALHRDGFFTVDWASVRGYVEDKITMAREA